MAIEDRRTAIEKSPSIPPLTNPSTNPVNPLSSTTVTILFGDAQTKLDKSTDLHSGIINFDFGFKDWTRLGDIRDTVKEQRVLSELSQLIDNDIDPSHKTEAGMQELVKLIHRNLTPNNPVMLAMNRVQPPAKTPRDFLQNFLG
jgi:hypothetical protein